MAAEITYTDHGDLFISAALARMIHENLVDKTDLRALCSNMGLINGQGSTAVKVPKVSWDDAMAAANTDEVTGPGNTDIGTGSVTITVARQVIVRKVTDLYELVGGPRPGIERYAADIANAAALRFTDLLCPLFDDFSNSVSGSSGNNLSVDHISDAMYQLIQSRVPGGFKAVLAPIQLTDFLDSLRGEGGSAEYSPATEALQSVAGSAGYGFHGSWRGVDFWSCDSVATDTGNREGAMFGEGAFGYMEGVPSSLLAHAAPGSAASVTPAGAPIMIEFDRDAAEGHTDVVGSYFVGVAELEDARGVLIASSST